MKWSKSDIALWLVILFLMALILGLYQAENHRIPPSLFDRTKANTQSHQLIQEGFEGGPQEGYQTSSSYDIAGGASTNYGYTYSDDYERKVFRGEILPDKVPLRRCTKKEEDKGKEGVDCYREEDDKHRDDYCRRCDILINDDIDKYVLKSSVPPMPDLSEYIRKSEIPACKSSNAEDINLDDYVHKSKIPKLFEQKECPKCPVCPTIPDDLHMHRPPFKPVRPEDIENLLQDARVKAYLDKKYACPKSETPSAEKKFFPPKQEEEEDDRVRPTMQIVKKKKAPAPAPTPEPTTTPSPAPTEEKKPEPDFVQQVWNRFLSLFGIGEKESYENPSKSNSKSKSTPNNIPDFPDVPFLSPPSYNADLRNTMIYNHQFN